MSLHRGEGARCLGLVLRIGPVWPPAPGCPAPAPPGSPQGLRRAGGAGGQAWLRGLESSEDIFCGLPLLGWWVHCVTFLVCSSVDSGSERGQQGGRGPWAWARAGLPAAWGSNGCGATPAPGDPFIGPSGADGIAASQVPHSSPPRSPSQGLGLGLSCRPAAHVVRLPPTSRPRPPALHCPVQPARPPCMPWALAALLLHPFLCLRSASAVLAGPW